MARRLKKQSTNTFAWEQFVGSGSEGFAASLAWGTGNDVQITDDVQWEDFVRGNSALEWLGYSKVDATTGNLKRILPQRCPTHDWMWCKAISGVPKIWTAKQAGEIINNVNIGPYSDFDRARCTLHFAPPPTAFLSDADLAAQYPFTIILSVIVVQGQVQIQVTDSSALYAGLTVTGLGIPNGTTVVSVDDATHVTLSNAANLPNFGTLTFTNPTAGAEQFRFCYWHEEPQLRVGQRNVGNFVYDELGGPTGPQSQPPPPPGGSPQSFVGFVPVQESHTDLICEWWFVPDAYIRSVVAATLNRPMSFQKCHGKVNSSQFSCPIGTFARGTLLLKHWSIEPQESPVPLPGVPRTGPQVLRKVKLVFDFFDPDKDSMFSGGVRGHNAAWYTDNKYYSILTSGNKAPPYPYIDFNILFLKSN
jgi:hypothetical protein